MWEKVFGGREKVRSLEFYAGISELHAFSWDECFNIWPCSVKVSSIRHRHRPSFRVSGPNQSWPVKHELDTIDFKFPENTSGKHLFRLGEAWNIGSLQQNN